MLLIDDLICAPGKFVFWILRQVHEAAEKELVQESERIRLELADLHRRLESRTISERDFDAWERELLDRLEKLEGSGESAEVEGSSDGPA